MNKSEAADQVTKGIERMGNVAGCYQELLKVGMEALVLIAMDQGRTMAAHVVASEALENMSPILLRLAKELGISPNGQ